MFLFVFSGLDSFKWLFEPIRLELDRVSAQMIDSRPESLHFWKLLHGLLGWGTTLRELKVPSGIAPPKKNKPPNGSVEYLRTKLTFETNRKGLVPAPGNR